MSIRFALALALSLLPARAQPPGREDLRQGLAALNGNDLVHAREYLESAAKQDPRNALVAAALAQTYWKSGQREMALDAAARAGELGPEALPVQYSLALFYVEAGDIPRSADWARRFEPPSSFIAAYGKALLDHGAFAEALTVLEKGQGRFPEDPQIVLSYGVACYVQRRVDDAMTAFLRVIHLDDSIEQPYIFLGRMLEHAGDRLPDVTAAYAAWEQKSPDNYLPVFLHARALLASPNPNPAAIETELRRSIQLKDDQWEAHLELGDLLAAREKWQDAERELSRAIALDPSQPKPHFDLARVYLRLGNQDRARAERAEYDRLKTAANAPRGTAPRGTDYSVPARP